MQQFKTKPPETETKLVPDETKERTIVRTCKPSETSVILDEFLPDYELLSCHAYQSGTGFGAFIECLLIFRLKGID